ncbi:MAG: tetratricopeptide repeat protein, partial [Chlamydiales bacterium]|nr:tetratricopeptide repeat protein [Chlamydiales bacterium]
MRSFFSFALILALIAASPSCHRVPDEIEPKINYAVQDRYLKSLPSPFSPLSKEELDQDWGKEYKIGIHFAHQLELYQAITAFKRAAILLPKPLTERFLEVQYEILLCYYIAKKYADVIDTFENSSLKYIGTTFPARDDLLKILYDSYLQENNQIQAERILDWIDKTDPALSSNLSLSTTLIGADFPIIEQYAATSEYPYLNTFLDDYYTQKKSPSQAQFLNAILPGTGYLYLGQTQSAITAFLLNGLFIAAAANFFIHHHLAAGIICTSFELGWYFGGILGSGLEAKYYNERLYERLATPM